jgi:phage-related protein
MTPNGWNEHKLMILSELQSLKSSIEEIKDSVDSIKTSVDSKIDILHSNIKSLDIQTAVLNTKSGVWGALGGIITTVAILLLSYIQAKYDSPQKHDNLPPITELHSGR